jgi:antitoxin component YwqK of YwqJK toxin-antitoxin module
VHREYFFNGTLKIEDHYREGKREGESKTYDDGGRLKLVETYSNGEVIDVKEIPGTE